MRELTIDECQNIAGAGLFEGLTSATLTAVAGTWGGMILGGRYGGSNGGIIGIGSFGALVGVIAGGIAGDVGGAVAGLVSGWDDTSGALKLLSDLESSLLNGTFGLAPDPAL